MTILETTTVFVKKDEIENFIISNGGSIGNHDGIKTYKGSNTIRFSFNWIKGGAEITVTKISFKVDYSLAG
jgi:hypothetical protein